MRETLITERFGFWLRSGSRAEPSVLPLARARLTYLRSQTATHSWAGLVLSEGYWRGSLIFGLGMLQGIRRGASGFVSSAPRNDSVHQRIVWYSYTPTCSCVSLHCPPPFSAPELRFHLEWTWSLLLGDAVGHSLPGLEGSKRARIYHRPCSPCTVLFE